MNYLQHIGAAQNSKASCADLRMLVSGVDALVREIVGRDIVSACYARGKTLFILDNTQERCPYKVNWEDIKSRTCSAAECAFAPIYWRCLRWQEPAGSGAS